MGKHRVLNPVKQRLRTISLLTFGYVVSAVALYDLQHGSLPALAREVISLYTLPLRYMFRPLYPVLKPFGMVVSDGADLPTPYGIVMGSLIYVGILMVVAQVFSAPRDTRGDRPGPWEC